MISPHILTLVLKDMLVPTDAVWQMHEAVQSIVLNFFKATRKDHLNDKFRHKFALQIDAHDSFRDILWKVRHFIDSAIIDIANDTKAIAFWEWVDSKNTDPDEPHYDHRMFSDMYYDVSIAQYDKGEPTVFSFYLYIGYNPTEMLNQFLKDKDVY